MINFDVTQCRIEAVKAVELVVAVRRLARTAGLDTEELAKLERSFRVAAAELQRVEILMLEGASLS